MPINPPHSNKNTVFESVSFKQSSLSVKYEECICFLEKIIEKISFEKDIKNRLLIDIEKIRRKCSDSNLYLAVVGEFSSGKTTFINALLRDSLLKTSALPTTAAATYLHYDEFVAVEVTLQSPRKGTIKTKPGGKQITVPWLPGIKNLDNRQFIHAVTTQDEIAKNVVYLKITHPSPFLKNQIVIIDTPGINANDQHGYVTQQVVAEQADAAIIIISATIPLSQKLSAFLSDSLAPFIHRCIFVITKMDQIPEDEVERFLKNLKKRLSNQLNIESPSLYACSAHVVIDSLSNKKSVSSDSSVWENRFIELESTILKQLHYQRSATISESILRLLNVLFAQFDFHLRSQWEHYQTTQSAIQNNVIPELNSFVSEQKKSCRIILDNAASTARLKVNEHIQKNRESTISELKDAIFSSKSEEALIKVVKVGIQEILDKKQKQLHQSVQGSFGKISRAVVTSNQLLDERFSAAYQKLQVLNSNIKFSSNSCKSSLKIDLGETLTATQTLNKKIDNRDFVVGIGGWASGALAGSLILPGIGTAVGGVLGYVMSGFFMPSLSARQEKIWEKLLPDIENYLDQTRSQVQQAVELYKDDAISNVEKQIHSKAKSYKSGVDEILAEQKTELQRLRSLQNSIQESLLEIETQRRQVTEVQQQLVEEYKLGSLNLV